MNWIIMTIIVLLFVLVAVYGIVTHVYLTPPAKPQAQALILPTSILENSSGSGPVTVIVFSKHAPENVSGNAGGMGSRKWGNVLILDTRKMTPGGGGLPFNLPTRPR